MFRLSAFADEISPDPESQLRVLGEEGIEHIELRGAWRKNVLDFTDEECELLKKMLDGKGFGVSAIGSPIGKIKISDPFEPHLERFERAMECARFFGTSYIRLFSYFLPGGGGGGGGEDPAQFRDEVVSRMREKAARAEEADLTLLHENEKRIYGETGARCRDILDAVDSPALKCCFDPANFVQCGEDPLSSWEKLKGQVVYFHIKDALASSGEVKPAGEGDGKIAEILKSARERGFDGFLSLEPHLKAAGTFDGFSGVELFKVAARALKELLDGISA